MVTRAPVPTWAPHATKRSSAGMGPTRDAIVTPDGVDVIETPTPSSTRSARTTFRAISKRRSASRLAITTRPRSSTRGKPNGPHGDIPKRAGFSQPVVSSRSDRQRTAGGGDIVGSAMLRREPAAIAAENTDSRNASGAYGVPCRSSAAAVRATTRPKASNPRSRRSSERKSRAIRCGEAQGCHLPSSREKNGNSWQKKDVAPFSRAFVAFQLSVFGSTPNTVSQNSPRSTSRARCRRRRLLTNIRVLDDGRRHAVRRLGVHRLCPWEVSPYRAGRDLDLVGDLSFRHRRGM